MYKYRLYQKPLAAEKARARRALAVQTAIIGGTVGFSVMLTAIATTLVSR